MNNNETASSNSYNYYTTGNYQNTVWVVYDGQSYMFSYLNEYNTNIKIILPFEKRKFKI
ncbi:MAG: hypothetical protein LBF97_01785 [Elusimicrobiota bacterium]|jgi:hypothetical protein|nr:hypothetical protein [Elusimicrobiota bacterium]